MTKLKNPKTFRKLSVAVFCIYAWLLVWVIFLKCNLVAPITDNYYKFNGWTAQQKWQFVRESFVALFANNDWRLTYFDLRQDLLNVIVFVPFGLYVAYFAQKRKLLWTVTLSFATSVCFELVQLTTLIGCFGAIDIVTNTFGGLLGWVVFTLIQKSVARRPKAWSIASIAILTIIVPISIYSIVNTLKILDIYVAILARTY